MPLNTNLSSAPYFDDFDRNDNYYRILFKPATAVQVREVNQLQTLLQDQIEQFGDHILKAGTILEGCTFTYSNAMAFVKITDNALDGKAINLEEINGLSANGQTSGKVGRITHVESGFENDAEGNLKTLYIDYDDDEQNTGDKDEFQAGEEIRIFARDDRLYDIKIANNASGALVFSNNDVVVITSAIEIAGTFSGSSADFSNTFTQGDTITGTTASGKVIDMEVWYSTDPATDSTEDETLILRVKPKATKMTGAAIDIDSWSISVGDVLTHTEGGQEFKIVRMVGEGATAQLTTTSQGQMIDATVTRGGTGYSTLPHVSVYSQGASSAQLNVLTMEAETWLIRLQAAQVTDTVGTGFGVEVSDGKIYQKGLFLNASQQFIMVDKYSNTPSDVSIGFDSTESIVNVFTDSSLYDNASGFLNEAAPGADRLKVSPSLVVKTVAEERAAGNFFPLVRFSEGKPFQQNKLTQYNKLGDMIAQRTYEESGNYVLDEFKAVSRSTLDFAESNTTFSYVIDPGHAYVHGYRVKTETNFVRDVSKGLETKIETGLGQDLVYSNYFEVHDLAGSFNFNTGEEISLRDTAVDYITNYDHDTSDVTSSLGGTEIGTAKIRSIDYGVGIKGTKTAVYKIHVFDVKMNRGKTIRDVKSIYASNGGGLAQDGIADVSLILDNAKTFRGLVSTGEQSANGTYDPVAREEIGQLINPEDDGLVLPLNVPAKQVTNYAYTYRTSLDGAAVAANGMITIPCEGSAGPTSNTIFPYIGNLTDAEENEIIVIPKQDITATNPTYTSQAWTSNTTSEADHYTIETANASVSFLTDFRVGDWITESANSGVAQITAIAGQNKMTVRTRSGAFGIIGSGTTCSISRYYPKDMPLPTGTRTGTSATDAYASVSADRRTMYVHTGTAMSTAHQFVVYFNQLQNNTRVDLTTRRKRYVKLTTAGQWPEKGKCVGISGVIRLHAVYNGTNVDGSGNPTDPDITSQFELDTHENANYFGLGHLLKRNLDNSVTLAATILVELDYITDGCVHGLKTVDSYNLNDSLELDDLRNSSSMHTLEIPEFRDKNDLYYDCRECADFRPMADLTAADSTTVSGATTDPSDTITFANYSSFKYPKPEGDFTYDIEYYLGRTDEISVKDDGTFEFELDATDSDTDKANKLLLFRSEVPPYPSLPEAVSSEIKDIYERNLVCNGTLNLRIAEFTTVISEVDPQVKTYTMTELAGLERRIEALEYMANISELENSTMAKSIPSSTDSTVERFKFGFFVDNFEDNSLSEIGNDYYDASIYEYVLHPDRTSLNIDYEIAESSSKYREGDIITFPYTRKLLLSQETATYAPFVEVPEVKIVENCDFETNRNMKNAGDSTTVYSKLQKVWEEFTFVGANEDDGTQRYIELKFFNPNKGIIYEIIQSKNPPTQNTTEVGTTVHAPTSTAVTALSTTDDAIPLYQKLYPVKNARNTVLPFSTNPWFQTLSGPQNVSITVTGSPINYKSYQGAGKIKIPYDYTKGRYITVRVHKGPGGNVFNFELCYPAVSDVDAIYDAGAQNVRTRPKPCPKGQFKYERCVGSNLYVYGCDGNYGTQVNRIIRNSPKCYIPVPPKPPEPIKRCPKAGTFYRSTCSGTTQKTYTYTGARGSGPGGCVVRVSDTVICSRSCGCRPKPPPVIIKCVVKPPPIVPPDDGCTALTKRDCNIKVETPPPRPPAPPPKPPKPPRPPVTPPPPPRPPARPPRPPIPKWFGPKFSCFVAGTLVDMADGSQKFVEDIQVGDLVMAKDGQHDTVSLVHDLDVATRVVVKYNNRITSTSGHAFLTTDGWKSAEPELSREIYDDIDVGLIQIGDSFVKSDGTLEEVTSMDHWEEESKVYNFVTEDTHTYVVDGIVTHNKRPPKPVTPAKPPKPPKPPIIPPPPPRPPKPPPPPPKPPKKAPAGGGGGGCVHIDSYLPMVTETQRQAWQMLPGSAIMLSSEDLENSIGTIEKVHTRPEPCVRIVTESGISLVCSHSAPIMTESKDYLNAPETLGARVAVMSNDEARFEEVTEVVDMGVLEVRPITAGNQNFWAGEKDGEYILHHNIWMSRFKTTAFPTLLKR